jgi:hypothetical protein
MFKLFLHSNALGHELMYRFVMVLIAAFVADCKFVPAKLKLNTADKSMARLYKTDDDAGAFILI